LFKVKYSKRDLLGYNTYGAERAERQREKKRGI